MSWIAVLLLAAGAIAANVPSSGTYNQIQGGAQQKYTRSGQQQYDVSGYENYEDSAVFGNNYREQGNSGNTQVPYNRNVAQIRDAKNQYLAAQRNAGQGYNNGQRGGNSDYNNPSGNSGYYGQYQGVSQGNYGKSSSYEKEQNQYNHAPYPENKRNGLPGAGVYGQGGYVAENQNGEQNDNAQNYRFNLLSRKTTPVPAKTGSINQDFGLSDLDAETLQEIQMFAEPVFALYTRNSRQPDKYQFEDALKILKNPKFDNKKKTLVYIHGFIEGLFADSVKNVVSTYLDQNDHNVLILDWHWYSSPPYFMNAVPNVQKVGKRAGVALLDMINSGLNLQRLHIVGHSLGGQMAGVIGRTIQKESRGGVILRRISALDPAFPGFYGIPNVEHLNEHDAEYVDVLHTDVGVYGAPISTGTVDFWPNSGLPPQPGCQNNVCSHQRSWWYWIGSMTKNADNHFNAVKANSWNDFVHGKVGDVVPDVTMGLSCPAGLYGNYYLQTNDALPYGKGEQGISYGQALIAAILPPTPLLDSENAVHLE